MTRLVMAQGVVWTYPLAQLHSLLVSSAQQLISRGDLLLIIDDLDRLTQAGRQSILSTLATLDAPRVKFVVVCGSTDVKDILTWHRVSTTPILQICALLPEDTSGQIPALEPVRLVWRAGTELILWPDDPGFGQVLTTPAMIGVARTLVLQSAADDSRPDLPPPHLRSASEAASTYVPLLLEELVMGAYAVDRNAPGSVGQWTEAEARRFLSFLASHLDQRGTQRLEWWHLNEAISPTLRGLTVQLGSGLLFALTFGLAFGLTSGRIYGLTFGLAFGVAFGAWGWPSGHHLGLASLWGILGLMFGGLLSLGFHFGGIPPGGIVVVVVGGLSLWIRFSSTVGCLFFVLTSVGLLLGLIAGVSVVGTLSIGVFVGLLAGTGIYVAFEKERRRGPAHLSLSMRGTFPSFRVRFVFGIFGGLFMTLLPATQNLTGFLVSVIWCGALGLMGGLHVWLNAQDCPNHRNTQASLLADRVAAACGALVLGAIGGIACWLIMEIGSQRGEAVFLRAESPGLPIAVAVQTAIVFLATRQSTRFAAAARWLALAGRLPSQLFPFLVDATRRGILVESGRVFQFRYTPLQQWLVSCVRGS
jgi:hypothetical protein